MQIVIDIYEEQYEHIKHMTMGEVKDYHILLYDICERIKNGTVLPKGYGRLIGYYDAVELINNKADEKNSNFTINDIEKFGALLREVNPIIKADKDA